MSGTFSRPCRQRHSALQGNVQLRDWLARLAPRLATVRGLILEMESREPANSLRPIHRTAAAVQLQSQKWLRS